MTGERFMKLAEEQDGFEFFQAYTDDEDRVMGGKGNTFWYAVMRKGKTAEIYLGEFEDGNWKDTYRKKKGKTETVKEMPSGTTIARIEAEAYLGQEEKWVKDRKGKHIEDSHPHLHYVYGFGDKALDISEQYGVTIGFSDLSDPKAGFHLRYLYTGKDVELP